MFRVFLLITAMTFGCDSAPEPETCTDLGDNICLDLSASGLSESQATLVQAELQRTLAEIRVLLSVSDLRISVYPDASGIIPEVGTGGFNPGPGEVRLFIDPSNDDFERIVENWFGPTLAHEVHHALRRRSVGYGTTLLEAAVTEGLADHFAREVTGVGPPPWSVALDEAQLDEWIPCVRESRTGTYNHARWFFGTSDVPRWAGYSVGYRLVAEALEARGAMASDLVDEPAESLVPAD